MTKKKHSTATQGPLYKIDQKVYTIQYHKGLPEELLEGKVITVVTDEFPILDHNGKTISLDKAYSYRVEIRGGVVSEPEGLVYGSFVVAAQVFAKAFLKILK